MSYFTVRTMTSTIHGPDMVYFEANTQFKTNITVLYRGIYYLIALNTCLTIETHWVLEEGREQVVSHQSIESSLHTPSDSLI